jgi:3-oxoacyl-[acyl-carrier protein] reductase
MPEMLAARERTAEREQPLTGERSTAVVVGASSGVGHAVATRLARRYHVIALSRRGSAPAGCRGVTADVTDAAAVRAALTGAAPEVVAICSGQLVIRPLLLCDDEVTRTALAVNLVGPWRVLREVLPPMVAAGRGRVVVTSSLAGLTGQPGQTAYAMAKGALIGLARAAAAEVGRHGVSVNVVVPGFVDTPMTAALAADRRDDLLAGVPIGRAIRPDEVAEAVEFLTTGPVATNGSVLVVDGGASSTPRPGWRFAS